MGTQSATHTLYEDWRVRRHRLASTPALHPLAYRDIQLRVLDYLLDRYRESSEAALPARFPSPEASWFNHRAIVVHHHLRTSEVGGVKTAQEARQRVSAIVRRISTPQEAPSDVRIRIFGFDYSAPTEKGPTPWQQKAVRDLLLAMKRKADRARTPVQERKRLVKSFLKTGQMPVMTSSPPPQARKRRASGKYLPGSNASC